MFIFQRPFWASLALTAGALSGCTADQQAAVDAGITFGSAVATQACNAYTKTAKATAICLSATGATVTIATAIASGEIQ